MMEAGKDHADLSERHTGMSQRVTTHMNKISTMLLDSQWNKFSSYSYFERILTGD
jgi:hypothetical protein